jgi:O-succinylbenzoate synthase
VDYLKTTDFTTYRYRLPLVSPIQLKQVRLTQRDGFIIEIQDEAKNIAFGEVAPFPGLHREDMTQALVQLKRLENKMINKELSDDSDCLKNGIEEEFSGLNLFPSVRFGVEMALINLMINRTRKSNNLNGQSKTDHWIRLNGLVTGNQQEKIKETKEYLLEDYSAIKVKVGNQSVEQDVEMTNKLVSICNNRAKIRLDANRSWTFDEAVYFGCNVGFKGIEYIEEPLINYRDLRQFYEKTKMPVALDETIAEIPPDNLKKFDWVKAIILKPSLIGSFQKTKEWTLEALKYNIDPILSNAFLSGVGLAFIANLATKFKLNHLTMGLETFKFFQTDLPAEPFSISNGKINVSDIYEKSLSIRKDMLEKV